MNPVIDWESRVKREATAEVKEMREPCLGVRWDRAVSGQLGYTQIGALKNERQFLEIVYAHFPEQYITLSKHILLSIAKQGGGSSAKHSVNGRSPSCIVTAHVCSYAKSAATNT